MQDYSQSYDTETDLRYPGSDDNQRRSSSQEGEETERLKNSISMWVYVIIFILLFLIFIFVVLIYAKAKGFTVKPQGAAFALGAAKPGKTFTGTAATEADEESPSE